MTYVNSAVGSAVMLSGIYELEGEVSRRPLNALPSLLVLARDAWDSPLVGLLAEEIVKDDPGPEAVLRVWFARRGRSLVLVPGQGTSWLSVRHA